jgi:acyl-coenzyme A thioesterase PaaI-like protein
MTAVGEVEVINEEGKLVAKAIATYSILRVQGRLVRVGG